MSTKSLAKELAILKTRVATLESQAGAKHAGWKAIYGAMKGQPLHREAAALGAAWRAKENKRK